MSEPDSPDSQQPETPHPDTAQAANRGGSAPEPSPERLAEETAATKFRQKIASHQAELQDYDAEENLWTGGYSPRAMFGTWALMGLVTLALLAGAVMIEQLSWTLAIGLIILMWLLAICLYASRRLGVHYQLTTQRFIHRVGLLTRQTDRIEVIDIDDVSFTQGPIERVMGVGTIVITSSDRSHPELTMIGIEKVAEVAGLIDDIRRKERRKRSLHIEAI